MMIQNKNLSFSMFLAAVIGIGSAAVISQFNPQTMPEMLSQNQIGAFLVQINVLADRWSTVVMQPLWSWFSSVKLTGFNLLANIDAQNWKTFYVLGVIPITVIQVALVMAFVGISEMFLHHMPEEEE